MKRKVTVRRLRTAIVSVLKKHRSTDGRQLQVTTNKALVGRIRTHLKLTTDDVVGGEELQIAISRAIKEGQIVRTSNDGLVYNPPKSTK